MGVSLALTSQTLSLDINGIYFSDLLFQKLPLIWVALYDSTIIFCYARTRIIKYSAINIFKDFRYNYLLTRNGAKESFEMIAVQQYKN
jgi:hypothetical protein